MDEAGWYRCVRSGIYHFSVGEVTFFVKSAYCNSVGSSVQWVYVLNMQYGIPDFLEGSYFILQYIKFIIAGCVLAVALCGCGRQVKLLTSETQTETQMMDDAGGEETVVSSAEAFATTTTEAETPEQEQSDDVAVYVCGAVRQPGVYYVAGSAIRETAVQMAGGFTDDADVTYVNLAQTVVAGEQIYIPTMEETNGISLSERDTDGTPVQDAPAGTNVETDGKININTAGKDALMTLPGIGESKADAIIAYREAQGKFQNTEELMNIRGIKEGIYNKIKDLIIVG